MVRVAHKFVCPECNEVVLNPGSGKGLLRCARGHRVQGVKERPAWMEAAISAFVAVCLGAFLIGMGSALSGNTDASAVIVALLFAAWATFLWRNGVRFGRAPRPAAELGPQYLGGAAGFLGVALLIGCGVAAGVFRV